MRRRPSNCFRQRPLTRYILTVSHPLVHSLKGNEIGDEGASALAAILKETQITHLKCAAAPIACLSAPVDTSS